MSSPITVYVPDWMRHQLDALKVNKSELVRALLESWLKHPDVVKVGLTEVLEMEKKFVESQITSLEVRLRALRKRLDAIKTVMQEREKLVKAMQLSALQASLIRQINSVIEQCHYAEDVAWELCKPLCRELTKLGYEADREWFKHQVRRVQSWR